MITVKGWADGKKTPIELQMTRIWSSSLQKSVQVGKMWEMSLLFHEQHNG